MEQWPQALRIRIGLAPASSRPQAVNWGPEYTALYNDAFAQLIGAKRVWTPDRTAREIFPETWDSMGPQCDGMMAGRQEAGFLTDQSVPLDRRNYLEECYWASSASPIRDDNGRVRDVFKVLVETTERVLEEKRRHLLSDLASSAAGTRSEEEVWRVSTEILRKIA